MSREVRAPCCTHMWQRSRVVPDSSPSHLQQRGASLCKHTRSRWSEWGVSLPVRACSREAVNSIKPHCTHADEGSAGHACALCKLPHRPPRPEPLGRRLLKTGSGYRVHQTALVIGSRQHPTIESRHGEHMRTEDGGQRRNTLERNTICGSCVWAVWAAHKPVYPSGELRLLNLMISGYSKTWCALH